MRLRRVSSVRTVKAIFWHDEMGETQMPTRMRAGRGLSRRIKRAGRRLAAVGAQVFGRGSDGRLRYYCTSRFFERVER